MQSTLALLTLWTLVLAPFGQASTDQTGTSFIEGLNDLPIIEGLKVADDPVVFDSPKGTIAEVILIGSGSAARYFAIYKESMTAFGWKCSALSLPTLTCGKTGEKLVFTDISTESDQTRLQVKLSPN